VLLACDGSVVARGPNGEREIAAADLFEGFLTTAVNDNEIVTEVRLPAMEGYGFAYDKFTRRAEDWAMVGVCALVKASGGQIEDARVAFTNMAATPVRATAVEDALRGQGVDAIAAASEAAAEGTDPPGDLNATPDYKRHLARVMTRRALQKAAGG
jgi:carbon-monoxide dehydrogenase medium subunit